METESSVESDEDRSLCGERSESLIVHYENEKYLTRFKERIAHTRIWSRLETPSESSVESDEDRSLCGERSESLTVHYENENQIEYVNHVHPLRRYKINYNCRCLICDESCLGGTTYGCNQCDLFLHESCTKFVIPQEIDHYFHPHPLRLAMSESSSSSKGLDFPRKLLSCKACHKRLGCLMFECRDCEFYMDVQCALLPTKLKQDGCVDHMQHFIHPHPLILCEIDEDCSICDERCLDRKTYGCNQCGLFLHESCTKIEIPREIDHYFHPHTLRLALETDRHFRCEACDDSLPVLIFQCENCYFFMDVECALLPTKLKQDECTIDHIQHSEHPHPLILCDDEVKYEEELCNGCGGRLSTRPCFSYDTPLLLEGSESIYKCLHLRCEFLLHERCARLPAKIDNPSHPSHSLDLISSSFDDSKCLGCDRYPVNHYTYQCPASCYFILGVECALLRAPILKLESHEHLLTLYPSVSPLLICQICNQKCDSSNIFRCIDCDYNLHLHCGPLPCSIIDKCHDDPLKLMHDFVEDGYEDDIVYCDVCEQPRDPDECGYYCKDCNFFAEIKCVEAEVLRSLNGERGNVKLRTANKTRLRVGAKLINNVTTDNVETDSDNEIEEIGAKYLEVKLHENFLSGCYTDEECEQLIEIFKKACVRLRPSTWTFKVSSQVSEARIEQYEGKLAELESKGKQELETSQCCNSSDEESDIGENAISGLLSNDFEQLMRNLDSYHEKYKYEFLDVFFRRNYNIVGIGEHKILQDSASVLKGLLHEYDKFTVKSKLSERLIAIFLTMFCQVIRSMCLTNIREVEDEVLHRWWKALKLAQLAGFEIQFAVDRLYKVVRASFGMKALTSYREKKSRIDKISKEIEEEDAELEAKKRELEAKKRELEVLKSHIDQRKYEIEYQSSPELKECLKRLSELKWKKAWDGSPIMFC